MSAATAAAAAAAAVLALWFDGDAAENYRLKWFASSSSGRQAAIDARLRADFSSTLRGAEGGACREWRGTPRGALALVVLLDQFSRHIYRSAPDAAQRIAANDSIALDVAVALLDELERSAGSALPLGFSVAQCVFALMPLRHTPTEARLHRVLRWVARLEAVSSTATDVELVVRFRRATSRQLEGVLDRATPFSRLAPGALQADIDAAILEHGAFAADESELLEHPLVATAHRFLHARFFARAADGSTSAERPKAVAISLSGGVDSMVLVKIIACLRNGGCRAFATLPSAQRRGRGKQQRRRVAGAAAPAEKPAEAPTEENEARGGGALPAPFDVVAVHIDYGNRAESGAEAAYVERYCASLGVHFRKRRVDEVKRGVTERSAYERCARDARFDAYRAAIGEFGSKTGVVFGHHRGDVQENVISNVMKGGSLLDVSGVAGVGVVEGVEIWRPLLAHPKAHILQFAHRYGVPYFRDTTPRWSTRGKLRQKLVPLLEDMYGDGVLEKLSALAAQSAELGALVDTHIFAPFHAGIKRSALGVWAHCAPWATQPHFFWAQMLRSMCHGSGYSMVKARAVNSFLERLRPDPAICYKPATLAQFPRNGWIPLKKGQRSLLRDGTLYIFAPRVFASLGNPVVERDSAVATGEFLCTVTFHTNIAHSLTRSP